MDLVIQTAWWASNKRIQLIREFEDPAIADGVAIGIMHEFAKAQAEGYELTHSRLSERFPNLWIEIAMKVGFLKLSETGESFSTDHKTLDIQISKASKIRSPKSQQKEDACVFPKGERKNICSSSEMLSRIEALYQKFPKHTRNSSHGKSTGNRIALKKFKTPEELDRLSEAVHNIAHLVETGDYDRQFIPMWRTFVTSKWEDFLTENLEKTQPTRKPRFRVFE